MKNVKTVKSKKKIVSCYDEMESESNAVIEFCENSINTENYDFEKLSKLWYAFFSKYLKFLGFNKKAIDNLFEWGQDGHNWKLLHWDTDENIIPIKQLVESFSGELDYITDRMSIDRLFRTHWEFNRLTEDYHRKLRYSGYGVNEELLNKK